MGWNEYWTKVKFLQKIYDLLQKEHFKEYEKLIIASGLKEFGFAELGAGSGAMSDMIQKRFCAHGSLFDNSREAFALFKQSRAGQNKKLSYFVKDIKSLDGKEQFELVFSDGLIEHFTGAERQAVLKKHFEITKKDCYTIVFAPRKSLKYDSVFPAMKATGLWCFGFEEPMTMQELEEETEKAGFFAVKKTRGFWENGVLAVKPA